MRYAVVFMLLCICWWWAAQCYDYDIDYNNEVDDVGASPHNNAHHCYASQCYEDTIQSVSSPNSSDSYCQ